MTDVPARRRPARTSCCCRCSASPGRAAEAIRAALARSPASGVAARVPAGARDGSATGLAVAALAELSAPAVVLDLRASRRRRRREPIASCAGREARLRGAGLVAGPVDVLVERGAPAVRALRRARLAGRARTATCSWDPRTGARRPGARRRRPRARPRSAPAVAREPRRTPRPATWTPQPRRPSSASARCRSPARRSRRSSRPPLRGRPRDADDLPAGARAQNAAGLERLRPPRRAGGRLGRPGAARRAASRSCASSPPAPGTGTGARRVGDAAGRSSKGRGITALFAGDSGTGKTMSAEVVAARPRARPVRRSTSRRVVDKYIGETEKNLDRIFTRGRPGQRGAALRRGGRAVRQALRGHGRPRPLRQHRGRVPAAADGAVRRHRDPGDEPAREPRRGVHPPARRGRRLPAPGRGATGCGSGRCTCRRRSRAAGDDRPRVPARARSSSAGGNIRNVCRARGLPAAADAGRVVTMADLVRGVASEYRKLGRMCTASEFGPYLEFAQPESLRPAPVGA